MSTRHVSVLCLSESQKDAVRRILLGGNSEANGDYLTGLVDEQGQTELEAGGFLYDLEPARAAAGIPGATAGDSFAARALNDTSADTASGASDSVVLDLSAPLGPNLVHRLLDAGAKLRERVGSSTYIAGYVGNLADLQVIAQVRDVRWFGQSATLSSPDLVGLARETPSIPLTEHVPVAPTRSGFPKTLGSKPSTQFSINEDGAEDPSGPTGASDGTFETIEPTQEPAEAADATPLIAFDVRCHALDQIDACASAIAAVPNVSHVEKGSQRIRFWARPEQAEIVQKTVSKLTQTAIVEPYIHPETLLDYARRTLCGGGPQASTGVWTGDGELVAVADTGIDLEHPDFADRVDLIGPTILPPDRDPQGHGTHVSSIIAGDGSASNGTLAGVAPKARLVVQRLGAGLTAMPLEISTLYAGAYDSGARIQNLSWGSQVKSHYVLNSDDLDTFVASHPDFLIVVAAGNWGVQDITEPGNPIGLSSLGAPASAKNCLTVGACCSPRKDGPYAALDWAQYDGSNPPGSPPMATLPLTGDDNIVAANSSRGPSDDNRIKPDLVAVGVGVAAARSADRGAPIKPWGNNGHYMYLTGTSMAAPVVSGAAALVRQYLREKRDHRPSAALLKAILINGARWLAGAQQEGPTIGQPNSHQGFGRLDLSLAFPLAEDAGFRLNITDIADTDTSAVRMETVGGGPAVNWRGTFSVFASDTPLAVTLCWTDPPGRWLQHDLDLALIGPDGKAYAGNNMLARMPGQKTDRLNNVEKILLPEPATGEWVVMVKAFNTFLHPQGFALAVTGHISDWIE